MRLINPFISFESFIYWFTISPWTGAQFTGHVFNRISDHFVPFCVHSRKMANSISLKATRSTIEMKTEWSIEFKGMYLKSLGRQSIPVIQSPIQQCNIKQRRECEVLLKSELFKIGIMEKWPVLEPWDLVACPVLLRNVGNFTNTTSRIPGISNHKKAQWPPWSKHGLAGEEGGA